MHPDTPLRGRILDELKGSRAIGSAELARRLEVDVRAVKRALRHLVDSGAIKQGIRLGDARSRVYVIAPEAHS